MASHGVARSARRELTAQEKAKELKQIEQYKDLVSQVNERYRALDFTSESLSLTSALLAQNPEYYSIWNYRRLILNDVFFKELSSSAAPTSAPKRPEPATDPIGADTTTTTTTTSTIAPSPPTPALTPAQTEISLLIREDLAFLLPLQRYHPKVYWLWNHRSWLLTQASQHLPPATATSFWRDELLLVEKMLGRDERNFHGWGYRREVVRALEELRFAELRVGAAGADGDGDGDEDDDDEKELRRKASLARQEFEYADKMVRANLSNFSAWHHRLQQIHRLLAGKPDGDPLRRQMFEEELTLVSEGLWVCTGPKDQSLWFYHGDLMATLEPGARDEFLIVKGLSNEERRRYVERQMERVGEILEDNDDCKWVYESLLGLGQLYKTLGGKVDISEMTSWLDELEKLDPLRKGRWRDLRSKLDSK